MRALLLVTLLFGGVDRSAIESLPELGRVESKGATVLVLRGNVSAATKARILERARAVVKDVDARFLRPAEAKRVVDVCLFERAADYQRFAEASIGELPSELGFYLREPRVVMINFQAGPRNMSHELAHPLIDDDFPGIPSWLAEGIGSLYGGSDVTPRGVRFQVNYRIRDVKQALAEKRLPPIARLVSVEAESVYGNDAMLWYGYARAALLFLESKGQLEEFYASVRDGKPVSEELARRIDDAQLAKFVATAKEGTRIEPPPARRK